MRKLFGTDGIRGTANTEPMTAETALKVAMAAAAEFTRGTHRHRVVVGKDTRLSGYMLEPALTAGFVSMGMDVMLVGPLPTPAVAMLTRSLRADLGVMISASHNPYQDNGIKLFGPDGFKLSDAVELRIEQRLSAGPSLETSMPALATPDALGRATRMEDARGRYIEHVKNTFPRGLTLDGIKVVVDCAHGAAYRVAPVVLHELGADVVAIGDAPDGFNINRDCGATATERLRAEVVAKDAHIGIALDGDADRLILCNEKGEVVDGDQIMALIAGAWQRQGRLQGDGIVATVMSNLGLEHYLRTLGLTLHRTPVGDRYVVEAMRAKNLTVGGEQSGHLILGEYGTTGDGLVAALQVLAELKLAERPASALTRLFTPLPQRLANARFSPGQQPLQLDSVQAVIAQAEQRLGQAGRLLIRQSGTEPLIRVMAEGEDAAMVEALVTETTAAIEAILATEAAGRPAAD